MDRRSSSRREFLSAAGAGFAGALLASDAAACRWRRRRCAPAPVYRHPPVHVCPPPYPPVEPTPTLRVRQNIASLPAAGLEAFKRGVAAMKARPASDPRSWVFQANIHGTNDPGNNLLWNQCEHGTLLFFAWHRGYLHFFERILRDAAGDPALNLPYWDWTSAPVLPAAFRTPADSGNPLFDTRNLNDGSALPPQVVADDLTAALDTVPFGGPAGFCPRLEGSPHGAVHVFVGGNMGSVPTAGRDPIFWLHHCNIDRLLDRWLNLGGGRLNPSDPAFLDRTYSFADERGSTVPVKVRDILSSAGLGYRYDNVPSPPGARTVQAARLTPPGDEKAARAAASSAPQGRETAPLADVERKPLGLKPETVKLRAVAPHAAALRTPPDARVAPGKVLLQIQGLSLAEVPNYTYAVYLNLPEGEVPPERARAHYVGTINFFGRGPGDKKHGHADARSFTETLDVTKTITRLGRERRWDPDALSVTLRPLLPVPPGGGEDALRRRTEESARRARITYQRINIVVTP